MTVEELLKPRYKLISDYPGNQYLAIGDIIELKEQWPTKWFTETLGSNDDAFTFSEAMLDKCNANFRKLDWWEERKLEDMPEYVKRPPEMKFLSNTVFKIDSWDETASVGWCSDHRINVRVDQCIPATEEDFLNQLNK